MILINPNGFDDKFDNDCVSITLQNKSVEHNINSHTCSKCLFTIRNCNNYSYYYTKIGKYIYIYISLIIKYFLTLYNIFINSYNFH